MSMSNVVRFPKLSPAGGGDENGLIASIYAAAITRTPWETILGALAGHMNLTGIAAILKRSEENDFGVMLERGIGPDNDDLQTRYTWPQLDQIPPNHNGKAAIWSAARGGREPISNPELSRSYGAHTLAVSFLVDDRPVQMRLYRPRHAAKFDVLDATLVERLVLHLGGALAIAEQNDRLRRQCDLHDIVMNRVHIGLLVIDSKDEVAIFNETAETMIAQDCGIRMRNNRVDGCHPADSSLLKRLIASARKQPGEAFSGHLSRPSENRDICVFVRTMPPSSTDTGGVPQVAIFLRDMMVREAMAHKTLIDMFGLTHAEVRLAGQFAVGCSVAEAAANLGIQLTTARGHLRSIFVKTGVNRQSELMRLLLI